MTNIEIVYWIVGCLIEHKIKFVPPLRCVLCRRVQSNADKTYQRTWPDLTKFSKTTLGNKRVLQLHKKQNENCVLSA